MKPKALLLPPILVLGIAIVFQGTREREGQASPGTTGAGPASEGAPPMVPPPRKEWHQAAEELAAGLPGGRVPEDGSRVNAP